MIKSLYFGMFCTLGDVIVSTAITHAVKKKYPDAKITYATSKEYIDVLAGNPDIDEVIGCGSHWEVILRSVEKPYDKVMLPLQLTGLDNAWHQLPPWREESEKHNLVDFYASRCNDDIVVDERQTYIYPEQKHWDELVQNIPDQFKEKFEKTPFITFHTTSRNASKDWPVERYKELAYKIKAKYGDKFLIYQIGGVNDPEIDKNLVVPLMGVPVLNTAALLKRSLVHLDGDSGPSFIADSVGTKTVVIFAATCGNTSGPISANVVKIEPPVRKCLGNGLSTPCHTHCRIPQVECKYEISVDQVLDVLIPLIEEKIK